jgi:hypothetical protein
VPFFIAYPYPQVYVIEATVLQEDSNPPIQADPPATYIFDPDALIFEKYIAEPESSDKVEE